MTILIIALSFLVYFRRRKENQKKMQTEQDFIEEARRLLANSGSDAERDVANAMHALAALVSAVRLRDGDQGAMQLLERGRKLFQEREGTDEERDIALHSLVEEMSLLKERGAEVILTQAFADGSSVLCRRCSGLVARTRWQAHKTNWCPAISSTDILQTLGNSNVIDDVDDDTMEIE